jgi:hypothetical protein
VRERPDWQVLRRRFEQWITLQRPPVRERDGVQTWAARDPRTRIPVVWSRASLACSAAALTRFVVDDLLQTHRQWYPMAESIEMLEALGDGERMVRIVNRMPWPMMRREDVYYNVRKELEAGVVVELSTSVEHDAAPPRRDAIRSRMHLAAKRMAPRQDGGCDYTALWHYDVAGTVGRLVPKRLLVGPMLRDLEAEVARLRSALTTRRDP